MVVCDVVAGQDDPDPDPDPDGAGPDGPALLLGGSILRHDGAPNLQAPAPLLAGQ